MESNSCVIFNKEEYDKLTTGLQLSEFMKTKQLPVLNSEDLTLALENLMVSDRLVCSFCEIDFINQAQQRQHYKLDWHRYNLKQHLAKRKPVSEEKFSQVADDVSSISGSESDSESEQNTTEAEDDRCNTSIEHIAHLLARRARILFQNSDGKVLAIYQCLFHSKKTELPEEDKLLTLAKTLPDSPKWTVIMLGGGHFAAAVFNGMEPILHKTFHSYTVRAKQGGSQSSKDNKGSHSKSAGASLRRYNEEALTQHIQEILSAWSAEVAACQLLFYRAVGPFNRSVLFSGRSPPLNKNDVRLRTIPFPTRRATFSEVKRVHSLLASVTVYESSETFLSTFSIPKKIKPEYGGNKDPTEAGKPSSPKKGIDRCRSRESPKRSLPDIVKALASCRTSESDPGDDLICVNDHLMVQNDQDMYLVDRLQEFADTVTKKGKKKKKKKEVPIVKEFQPEVASFRKKVFAACEIGDTELLKLALSEDAPVLATKDIIEALNQVNSDGITLLQIAASHSFKDIVWTLLQHGGDPTTKDTKSCTAYDFAPDKETRNIFRRFMGEFPDKYNYSKSHIPSPLTDFLEQEQVEKKRALKKAKRQKEKEKKIADAPRRAEEAEKKRFLELSDREKCALAAERRALAAAGKAGVVLVRCYTCATDITGKVPFTYDKYQFCSMPCLKAHRQTHKTTL